MDRYDELKLDYQLCFPLYACAREIIKKYRPYLDNLDLTYTQYIAMMVIWEKRVVSAKDLGEKLYLDSGTLTPVLKSLEGKGIIRRYRLKGDERVLLVELTEAGEKLREEALDIPQQVGRYINLEPAEVVQLYKILYKLLRQN